MIPVTTKDLIKSTLQISGLFPLARSAYRRLNPKIQNQRHRELQFYTEIIPRNGLCFDVGANLGQRSETFLDLGCRTVIVEPNPECLTTLDFLFSRNSLATIVPIAVGASTGTAKIYSHGTDSTASLRPDWDRKVFGIDRGQTAHNVAMTTIDSLMKQFGRPDFIKIDVEGYELDALKGLSQSVPVLSLEFHHDDPGKTASCVAHLQQFGSLSVRAASMDCEWIGGKTDDVQGYLETLCSLQVNGDLFIWSS
jgi:FkbM family methyltransferase